MINRASKTKKKGGQIGESASTFKRGLESIDIGDGKCLSLQNLLFQPILQLTKRSAIVQVRIGCLSEIFAKIHYSDRFCKFRVLFESKFSTD